MTPKDFQPSDLASMFTKKIVASHYLKLVDYFELILDRLARAEWRLSRGSDRRGNQIPQVGEQWSSLQLSQRKLSEHCDDLEDILLSLGISSSYPDPICSDWRKSENDFQYIHHHLRHLRARVDQKVESVRGLSR
jgi:hypothetical protein